MRPAATRSPLTRALMVGAVGAFTAWLAQTSVDWMHLLPGLTAIAIAAAAVLVRPRRLPRPAGAASRHSRFGSALAGRPALALGASAVVVTLIVAGASLSRQGLADLYRARAQNELTAQPASALADANRSLEIDSDAVETYYVKAAALAHFDQAAAAVAALRTSARPRAGQLCHVGVARRHRRARAPAGSGQTRLRARPSAEPTRNHSGGTVARSGLRAALTPACP